jgi:hypothetical protein
MDAEALTAICKHCASDEEPWTEIHDHLQAKLSAIKGRNISSLVVDGTANHYDCCLCKETIPDGHTMFTLTNTFEVHHGCSGYVQKAWLECITCEPCASLVDVKSCAEQTLDVLGYRL